MEKGNKGSGICNPFIREYRSESSRLWKARVEKGNKGSGICKPFNRQFIDLNQDYRNKGWRKGIMVRVFVNRSFESIDLNQHYKNEE